MKLIIFGSVLAFAAAADTTFSIPTSLPSKAVSINRSLEFPLISICTFTSSTVSTLTQAAGRQARRGYQLVLELCRLHARMDFAFPRAGYRFAEDERLWI